MERVLARVLPGVVLVLALAGCQDGSRYENLGIPTQYQSGAAIRDALERSGVSCTDFRRISDAQRDIGETDAREVDTCRVDDSTVTMMTWLTLGDAQDWARSRKGIECRFARSLGTPPPIYVDGGRWTIAVDSQPVAKKIADAIGGEAKVPDCTNPFTEMYSGV